jgi:glutaredoxin
LAEFAGLNVQVLGISVDHVPCLKAWADSLGGISFPLLSDFWPHGAIADQYGVLRPDGFTERAVFIIDGEGIVRYIDIHNIDEQPSNDVLFAELEKIDPGRFKLQKEMRPAASPELPKGGVVLYCTSWCPDCRRARLWLEDNKIAYTEVNIDANPEAAKQLRKWANGNLTTPTFDIDGTIIVDFDIRRVKEALGKK